MGLDVFVGDRLLLRDVENADGLIKRFRGLMLRADMDARGGLLIRGCNWIHTFFMRFPLTVVYLDKDYSVVDIDPYVVPWKICMPRFGASHVLELRASLEFVRSISKGEVLKCIA